MAKENTKIIIDAIIKEAEHLEWLTEYLKCGNIYKITPPNGANNINAYGYYVYAIIDPFCGSIFYIGKGKGKRAYDHFNERNKNNADKKNRINEIYSKGEKAIIWVLQHNMEEDSAFDLEALLINVIAGLTNISKPVIKETNKWFTSNMSSFGYTEVECIEADCISATMKPDELLDLMATVVCNGYRTCKNEHNYILNSNFYDFSDTIHLLPARLRNAKSISLSEYIDKIIKNA